MGDRVEGPAGPGPMEPQVEAYQYHVPFHAPEGGVGAGAHSSLTGTYAGDWWLGSGSDPLRRRTGPRHVATRRLMGGRPGRAPYAWGWP